MSALLIAAAVLSCGLNAAPDGTPAPKGSIVMMNATISDDLAQSMATQRAPAPTMSFIGESNFTPEWIVRMEQESETKFKIARLSTGFLAYGIQVGWVELQSDGTYLFSETAARTCQIKQPGDAPKGTVQ